MWKWCTGQYQNSDGAVSIWLDSTDYRAVPATTLVFDPGQTSKRVRVTVRGDGRRERNERFFVNLTNLSNVTAGDLRGLGTIVNDDR